MMQELLDNEQVTVESTIAHNKLKLKIILKPGTIASPTQYETTINLKEDMYP